MLPSWKEIWGRRHTLGSQDARIGEMTTRTARLQRYSLHFAGQGGAL